MNIGFIGLGIMGTPMAGHLLKAGHRVFVHSVPSIPADVLAAGAVACASGTLGTWIALRALGLGPGDEALYQGLGRTEGGAFALALKPQTIDAPADDAQRSVTYDPSVIRYVNRWLWELLRFALPIPLLAVTFAWTWALTTWTSPDITIAMWLVLVPAVTFACAAALPIALLLLGLVLRWAFAADRWWWVVGILAIMTVAAARIILKRAPDAPSGLFLAAVTSMAVTGITVTFAVTGLTCGHCVGAVTDELRALPGVSEVEIDLVAGGVSTVTVTASAPLTEEQVTAALDEAGNYHLANI